MFDIGFLHPVLLSALLALPLLAWWLRAAPPPPRTVLLPTFHFLEGLQSATPSPCTLPWWLLLLRLAIMSLIILALAEPVTHPTAEPAGTARLRLVLDTSWAAAPAWESLKRAALAKAEEAGRSNRLIEILTTAAAPGTTTPPATPPLTAGEAAARIKTLTPSPWPSDLPALKKSPRAAPPPDKKTETLWLGSGLREDGFEELIEEFAAQGPVTYLAPPPENSALILRQNTQAEEGTLALHIDIPRPTRTDRETRLTLSDTDGRTITHVPLTLKAGETGADISLPPPGGSRPLQMVRLDASSGAGAVFLPAGLTGTRKVALVGAGGLSDTAPLTTSAYYLTRALKPYADLTTTDLSGALASPQQVIIAPDLPLPDPEQSAHLSTWIEKGGILLRFSGKSTVQNGESDTFLPVPLRGGQRTLTGLAHWATPPDLAPFPPGSPFAGLPVPAEINLRQQALARPIPDLARFAWAILADGTPLITARQRGTGWIVLVHTTADPAGSDLPLSGFYLTLLKTVLSYAGQSGTPQEGAAGGTGTLTPVRALNAAGTLIPAPGWARPVSSDAWTGLIPGPSHPPGLYRQGGRILSLNLGERIPLPEAVTTLPAGVIRGVYTDETDRRSFKAPLLALAFALMAMDALALWGIGGWTLRRPRPLIRPRRTAALLLIAELIVLVSSLPARAEPDRGTAPPGAVPLACLKVSNSSLNQLCQQGLNELGKVVRMRTAIDVRPAVLVNALQDDLSTYPLLVWPLRAAGGDINNEMATALRTYLDRGGLLLIDSGDGSSTPVPLPTAGGIATRKVLHILGLTDLTPIHQDHVLRRSFYLLDRFPGALDGATLWLQQQAPDGQDGVSPVIWGSHDWLTPWAEGLPPGMVRGSSEDQELAFRFGINVLMYALTGNYKTDQVHLPFIMERLGSGGGGRP